MGENSGGYVGYGEVGLVFTPIFNFELYTTMTMYNTQKKYEVVGIAPDVLLSNDQNWIETAVSKLKN